MSELTRAITKALDSLAVDPAEAEFMSMEKAAERIAAALAAVIEARVREALRSARSEELDDVAAEFERSANRVEKAKGATERTRYAHEVAEVLRNRAQEIRDAD